MGINQLTTFCNEVKKKLGKNPEKIYKRKFKKNIKRNFKKIKNKKYLYYLLIFLPNFS
jgi:hypothetical protein